MPTKPIFTRCVIKSVDEYKEEYNIPDVSVYDRKNDRQRFLVPEVPPSIDPNNRITRSEEERRYDEIIASCKFLSGKHQKKPSKEKFLYSVTTIAASQKFGGTRTPVICNSFRAAKKIVENNIGDIWEHSYMLCVIESVQPNVLYGSGQEKYWYKFDKNTNKYLAIEEPEFYSRTVGWCIG